jgi:hypothetical protein
MRTMHVIRVLAIGFVVSMMALAVPLGEIQKIFVGTIGGTDGDRFRLLLSIELVKHGFAVVDKEIEADGVLAGAVTTFMVPAPHANATMMLKNASGVVLWQADIAPTTNFSIRDPLHSRAIDVAERIQKACKKARIQK